MAKFRRLVLLSLSLGLALAGGCRSPDALAATPTDTSVTLTDWQAGTDLTNFQHPRPYQYLALINRLRLRHHHPRQYVQINQCYHKRMKPANC